MQAWPRPEVPQHVALTHADVAHARPGIEWAEQLDDAGRLALQQCLRLHAGGEVVARDGDGLQAVAGGYELETVAVDWEQVGPASAGADISTLVFGTMRRCEFDAERATELDETVFTGYVAGLREAGWQGRVEEIRLGFTAAVGLRWTVLAGILQGLLRQ